MFKNLYYDYFLLNLKDYSNIGIDFQINKFLLVLFFAMGIGFFIIDFHRGYMALTVKQLMRHKAFSEGSACTLGELGLGSNRAIKRALSKDSRLARIVLRVGAVKYTYEEYMELMKKKAFPKTEIDFDEARFYIDEKNMERAKYIYDNYSGSKIRTVLCCVLLLALYICLLFLMPEILRLINNLLGRI